MLVPVTLTALITISTSHYECRVTGDGTDNRDWRSEAFASNFHVGRLGSLLIEAAVGLGACMMAFATENLFLGAVAVGIAMAPLLDVLDWEFPVLVPLRHVPFLLLCIQLFLVAIQVPGLAPLTNGLVFTHF